MDRTWTAVLQQSPSRGGWTYVVRPGTAGSVRRVIGKQAGDEVEVRLLERVSAVSAAG